MLQRGIGAWAVACALAAAVPLTCAATAQAQGAAEGPDEATRMAARQLAKEGLELLRKRKYAEAQDRLHRAYEIIKAPTVLLLEARALEGMGRLVAAAEAYEKVRQTKITDESPEPYEKAAQDAAADLKRMRPMIPQITVVLEGIGHETPGFEIRVDGVLLPKVLLGARRPVDPGKHEVVATLDGKVVDRHEVTLKPGQTERVPIRVKSGDEPPPPPPPEEDAGESDFPYETAAWVGLGVGGAGLATGAVFLGIQLSKKSTLDDNCRLEPDGTRSCPEQYEDDLSAYNTARSVTTVGFVVGAVGLAVGIPLLMLAPDDEEPAVEAYVGPGQVGIAGRF